MNITKVQIHLVKNPDTKGYADIILDNEFIVRGLTIIERDDGVTVVNMPNKERKDPRAIGGFRRLDVAHPITEPCRRYIENTVLDEYEVVLTSLEIKKPVANIRQVVV